MPTLFLLNANWDEPRSLVTSLEREAAKGDAIILALDFWAGKKFRDASIAYETPRDYLDVRASRHLDELASGLARTWYKPLGKRLHHNGIPIGQMAEYDFTFLFIDALRSVAIAHRIFRERAPGRVVLCPQLTASRPNAICYESLPGVLDHLARQRNLRVSWISSSSSLRRAAGVRSDTRGYHRPRRAIGRRARNIAFRGFASARALFLSLATRSGASVLLIRLSYHARIAEALGHHGLRGLNSSPIRAGWIKARLRAAPVQRLWQALKEDPAFQQRLLYDGVPLSDILDQRFREFFHQGAPDLIEYIEGAEWLIRRLRPRMLVVPEDLTPVLRAVCRTFRRRGLPVLVIQHGAVGVDMGGFHVMPLEAERQAVWGEMVRKWHIRRGKPEDSQVITGNPGFDPIASDYDPGEVEIRRRLGLSPSEGIILLATEWFSGISSEATVEGEERFIRYTLRALRELPRHQVVVKLHPNYQTAYERLVLAIAEEEGIRVTIAKDHLWDLLKISDLVIVSNSTVGLEAMMLGRPIVFVHTYEGIEEIPYVASKAARGASRPEEIASAAARALNEDQRGEAERRRNAFVQGYAFIQDGRASDRVAQLIWKMCAEAVREESSNNAGGALSQKLA